MSQGTAGSSAAQRGRPFKPGQSGNPGGWSKADAQAHAEFVELARSKSGAALMKLAQIMLKGNGAAAVRAAEVLLDRAWGKATQRTELTGVDGAALSGPPIVFMLPPNGRDIAVQEPPEVPQEPGERPFLDS